jgi:alpha-beta hydrolase superfamily lysophospholipase
LELVGVALWERIADNLIKKGYEVYAFDVVQDGIKKVPGIKAVERPGSSRRNFVTLLSQAFPALQQLKQA